MPLGRIERASGRVLGGEPGLALLDARAGAPRTPREAIKDCVTAALRRPPCVVSFSGGWDSSAVLAVAAAIAREEGLPAPVPVTLRFGGVAGADESAWQELVIAHLGLADWELVDIDDELDLLGDTACAGLAEHGLLWPANVHCHVPVFARARGGTVLTGLDGDGLLGGWRWQHARALLHRQVTPGPRDALRVALAAAPPSWRRRGLSRSLTSTPEWIRPGARPAIARALLDDAGADQPRSWGRYVEWYSRRRYLTVGLHSLGLLARAHDVTVSHPLIDPGHLAALAREGGRPGFGSRHNAMVSLFGDLLPPELLDRRTKAVFDGPLWGPRARAFAADWNGQGIDPASVDADALRAAWSSPSSPLSAGTLLQAAWLATQAR